MPPRPISRKLSAGLPVAAPPVQYSVAPSSASIMPRVTMKLGTLRNDTIRPFTSPMNAPNASMKANTGQRLRVVLPDEVARDHHLRGDHASPSTGRTRRRR